MKILYLFLFAILLLVPITKAQVYNGDLTLTSQAEIDAFNYTSVVGTLLIKEQTAGNITNLDGLSMLVHAYYFFISDNSALTNINGSANLTTVDVGLGISNNASLTNIDGFPNISTLGYLDIGNNPALTNINGFSNLTSLLGLTIQNNDVLNNINGLSNLSSLDVNLEILNNEILQNIDALSNLNTPLMNLFIRDNPSLTNIDGLSGVTSISSNTVIQNNDALKNLDGLNGLYSMGGHLRIIGNQNLSNVDGLSNISSLGEFLGFGLEIRDNDSLTNLNGLSNITSIGGGLDIQGNNELSNIEGLSSLVSVGGNLLIWVDACTNFCSLYPLLFNNGLAGSFFISNRFNPPTKNEILAGGDCSQYFTLSSQAEVDAFNNTSLPGSVIIDDAVNGNITNLNGLSELTSIGGYLIIANNPALNNISGLSNLTSIGEKFQLIKNHALTNLNGLSNLNSIGGDFHIFHNSRLANINGLSGLASIGNEFKILNNTLLTNLNGLSGLTSIGNDFFIMENPALLNLHGLANLISIGRDLRIRLNNALPNLIGLSGISSLSTIEIMQNNSLLNLNSLYNLTSVDYLNIRLNPVLNNLDGLSNLVYAGTVAIISNYGLLRYCGLYALFSSGTYGPINIEDNPNYTSPQQIVSDGPCPPSTEYPYMTIWGVNDDADGKLQYYTLEIGNTFLNIEGDIEGISGDKDIEDLIIDGDLSITSILSNAAVYLMNNVGTSTLYKLNFDEFDQNAATPVTAVLVGSTNLPSNPNIYSPEEISSLLIYYGELYGLSLGTKKLYAISKIDGSVVLIDTLNVTGEFRTDGMAYRREDGIIYLLKTNDTGESEIWKFTNFPNGEIEYVRQIETSGKVEALTTHPDGYLYASDDARLYQISVTNPYIGYLADYTVDIEGMDYYYEAEQINPTAPTRVFTPIITVLVEAEIIVTEYALDQNYPNPFNPSTKIRWQMPEGGYVSLKIYDVLGNEVASLVDEEKSAGAYNVEFNASLLSSGLYLYKLKAGTFSEVKKMILMK